MRFSVVLNQRTYAYSAEVVTSSMLGSVLWPQGPADAKNQFVNDADGPQINTAVSISGG
jgi:hypothetical protein